jgi:hypothetical protein
VNNIPKSQGMKVKSSFLTVKQRERRHFLRYMIPGAYTSVSLYLLTMKSKDVRKTPYILVLSLDIIFILFLYFYLTVPPMLDECLEYLEECSQSGLTYEVIVVSDGSTDKTVDLAHHYSSKYNTLRVLNLVKNRGKGVL